MLVVEVDLLCSSLHASSAVAVSAARCWRGCCVCVSALLFFCVILPLPSPLPPPPQFVAQVDVWLIPLYIQK